MELIDFPNELGGRLLLVGVKSPHRAIQRCSPPNLARALQPSIVVAVIGDAPPLRPRFQFACQ